MKKDANLKRGRGKGGQKRRTAKRAIKRIIGSEVGRRGTMKKGKEA